MVDVEIGKVLDGLEQNGFKENTLVVFTSDHGDGAASHKWAAKLSLYEESSKIPFVVTWPGQIQPEQVNKKHLVSQIDILPTMLDYAGIKSDIPFTGKSLRPVIENGENEWRNYLIVELADYKPDSTRKGRMVRTKGFKYNIYSTGKNNEQLFDLHEDPGENRNLINDPEFRDVAVKHRSYLKEWMEATNDDFTVNEP